MTLPDLMDSADSSRPIPIYRQQFTVSPETADENGHVNNVVYVQWMQDVAIRHAEAVGSAPAMREAACIWVARFHKIEYLSPAYPGDLIEARTWISDFRGVRSLRRYRFERVSDHKLIASGETEWVCVSARSGRPRPIPEAVRVCFVPECAAPTEDSASSGL